MKVICICPTYNRPGNHTLHLLEEAVESFLRQEKSPGIQAQLVIVNDCPGQEIAFDHPNVNIMNLSNRISTLGGKYNLAIESCEAAFIMNWEDDDISLSHRIVKSVEMLTRANWDYYNPKGYWFYQGTLKHPGPIGYSHNCSIFTKKAWEQVGGYPLVSGPQDARMDGLLRSQVLTNNSPLPSRDWWYIYRWGVSPIHLSGMSDTNQAYINEALKPKPQGIFRLKPHWVENYDSLVRQLVKGHP